MLLPRMTLADKVRHGGGHRRRDHDGRAGPPPGRLCVPAMGLQDGPNGVGDGLTGVTQLPAGVSLAAAWDPALAEAYGKVIGAEERGKGKAVNLGPTVNIDRDPRWGRTFEAYTEDPYLNAAITVAVIDGVQSQGVMSQVKHFAVYNQETNRNTPADDAIVSSGRCTRSTCPRSGRRPAGQGGVGHVRLQHGQRRERLSEPVPARHDAGPAVGLPRFVGSDFGATHSTVRRRTRA